MAMMWEEMRKEENEEWRTQEIFVCLMYFSFV
jgi:hypothetical protein